mmetsp:Transcript_45126/g.107310  ORF Transcript_45126/g.107310 Transcript_45126/m.107310 type:complete len:417 (-) Transcript_45126:64-1314(-)
MSAAVSSWNTTRSASKFSAGSPQVDHVTGDAGDLLGAEGFEAVSSLRQQSVDDARGSCQLTTMSSLPLAQLSSPKESAVQGHRSDVRDLRGTTSTQSVYSSTRSAGDDLLTSQSAREYLMRMQAAEAAKANFAGNFGYMVCLMAVPTICIVLGIKVKDKAANWAKELKKHRDSWGQFFCCVLVETLFSALPLPGRGPWTMVIGFAYGYEGFQIVLLGSLIGCLLAFVIARRLTEQYCRGSMVEGYLICCCSRQAHWNRVVDFILVSIEVVQEHPVRTVSLLSLSVPPSLMSYLLGAKTSSEKLPAWLFILSTLPGAIMQIVPVHLGVQCENAELLSSVQIMWHPRWPSKKGRWMSWTWSLASIMFALCSSLVVGRAAWQRLRQDSKDSRYSFYQGNGHAPSLTLSLCRSSASTFEV